MIPSQIASHPEAAADLLTQRYRDKLVTVGVVKAITKPFDALEQASFDTLNGRGLEVAVGFWLDAIGKIVGEPRNGRDDEDYLASIRVRVRVNRSQGRATDLIAVALLLDSAATYLEYRPLSWEVEIYGTYRGGDFIRLLTQAKAATSYGVLHTSSLSASEIMRWDTRHGVSLGAGHKWSSAHGASGGGKWCAALTTNPPYRLQPTVALLTESSEPVATEGGSRLLL